MKEGIFGNLSRLNPLYFFGSELVNKLVSWPIPTPNPPLSKYIYCYSKGKEKEREKCKEIMRRDMKYEG